MGAVARERMGTCMSEKADDDRAVKAAWEEDNAEESPRADRVAGLSYPRGLIVKRLCPRALRHPQGVWRCQTGITPIRMAASITRMLSPQIQRNA